MVVSPNVLVKRTYKLMDEMLLSGRKPAAEVNSDHELPSSSVVDRTEPMSLDQFQAEDDAAEFSSAGASIPYNADLSSTE